MTAEEREQAALFQWVAYNADRHPALRWLFHCPNGGHRIKAVAAKLKALGVRRGVPDLWLPVPRGDFHGLVIELKAGRNKATPEQDDWLRGLGALGYKTTVATGWEQARDAVLWYLELPEPAPAAELGD